jgi:hypothetical protein
MVLGEKSEELCKVNSNKWEQEGKIELMENSVLNSIYKEYYHLACDAMLSGRF